MKTHGPDHEGDFSLSSRDYEFIENLGGESFGATTSCRHRPDGETVCIKAISSFFVDKIRDRQKFIQEICNLSKLRRPAVPLKDVSFPDQEAPYHYRFVSQFIDRESLREFF